MHHAAGTGAVVYCLHIGSLLTVHGPPDTAAQSQWVADGDGKQRLRLLPLLISGKLSMTPSVQYGQAIATNQLSLAYDRSRQA